MHIPSLLVRHDGTTVWYNYRDKIAIKMVVTYYIYQWSRWTIQPWFLGKYLRHISRIPKQIPTILVIGTSVGALMALRQLELALDVASVYLVFIVVVDLPFRMCSFAAKRHGDYFAFCTFFGGMLVKDSKKWAFLESYLPKGTRLINLLRDRQISTAIHPIIVDYIKSVSLGTMYMDMDGTEVPEGMEDAREVVHNVARDAAEAIMAVATLARNG